MSSLEIRARLEDLRHERVMAAHSGLLESADYAADLEAEIAECLQALTVISVSEIASLQAVVGGALQG